MNNNNKENTKPIYGELPLENILFVSNGEKPYVVFRLDNVGHSIALSKKCIFKSDKTFKFLIVPNWEYEVRFGDVKKQFTGDDIFKHFIKDKYEVSKIKPYEKL